MVRKSRPPVNTDKQVERLKPEAKKYAVKVKDMTGLYVRVTPLGFKSYAVASLDPFGKQQWVTLGGADVIKIDEAKDQARIVIPRIKAGQPPFPPPEVRPETFKAVAENYMVRHVQKKGLHSAGEIRRCLEKYVYPILGGRDFLSIKKTDVAKLLDHVEDNHGPRQADLVLSYVRQVMKWYEDRDDTYVCVVTGRMRRADPKERRRKRKLDDHEICLLWAASEDHVYGAMARLALLTGQRREPIASLRWSDVSVDGIWTVPSEVRQKGTGEVLPLSEMAQEVIKGQERVPGNLHVFTGRTAEGHFNGYSVGKKRLDARIVELNGGSIPQWQFHDLRRTARSLLARAQELAERTLGHTQDTIVETYDVHDYQEERGQALQKLEGLIKLILNPPEGNVVQIEATR
jgi:integrase